MEEKRLLLANGIAVWDVISFLSDCRVFGQLHPGWAKKRCGRAFAGFRIEAVFCNGAKSWELYHRYLRRHVSGKRGSFLTSPAMRHGRLNG